MIIPNKVLPSGIKLFSYYFMCSEDLSILNKSNAFSTGYNNKNLKTFFFMDGVQLPQG